jgi:hypothetical protein
MNIRDVNTEAITPRANRATGTLAAQNGLGTQQTTANNANQVDRLILTPEGERLRATMQNLQAQQQSGNLQLGVPEQGPRLGLMQNPLAQPLAQTGQALVQGNEPLGIGGQTPLGQPGALMGNPMQGLMPGRPGLQTIQEQNQPAAGAQNPLQTQLHNPGVLEAATTMANPAAPERGNAPAANPEQTAQGNLTRILQEAARNQAQNQLNQNPMQNPMLNLLG